MFHWMALALLLASGSEKPKLMVLELVGHAGVDREVAGALTAAVTQEVSARGFYQVMSTQDVQALLGLKRQNELLGCADDAAGCLTELAGAIGARFVLSGAVAKLGDSYQLTLQLLDSQKAIPVARSMRLAQELTTLRAQIPYAVAEATGTPLPPSPSRVLPYSLLGSGGALIIAGGIIGLSALSQEALLQTEIDQGQRNPAQLKTVEYYSQARAQYGVERSLSLAALVAGAALISVGIYTYSSPRGEIRIALLPTAGGAAAHLEF